MATTTPGCGCARGEMSLTSCHMPGSRSGEWATWGCRGVDLPAQTALAAPTSISHLRKGRAGGWRAGMFWVCIQQAFDVARSYKGIFKMEWIILVLNWVDPWLLKKWEKMDLGKQKGTVRETLLIHSPCLHICSLYYDIPCFLLYCLSFFRIFTVSEWKLASIKHT